ncbi:ATP-binding protein [Polaromonas sp.]|uniref:sensor histidine kinase n=1 Tax=Polaromonas sp. TaxID=1869339 RepID=UPI0017F5125D|nr:ATP-binding protein [Polaromonas sp.]NMM08008.1 PAS domain S-box protein [Polaromonas sp.]
MRDRNANLIRTTTRWASVIAGLIALSLPLGFLMQALQSNLAAMREEAKYGASNLSRVISANPDYWQFEAARLQELIKDMTETSLPESRRIVDATGRVIVQSFESKESDEHAKHTEAEEAAEAAESLDPHHLLVISRKAPLMDSGKVVGHYEVLRNVQSLLLETALVGLLSLFLGAMVLLILRVYPVRALKRTLATLANEKERAEVTMNSIGDAVITVTAAGTVNSFNPAAAKLFGHTADQVVGHDIKMLMPQAYRHALDSYLERYPHTGQAYLIGLELEVTAQRSNGEIFPMELRISEFYLEGRRQFIGSMRDISERKLARDEILALNASLEERVQQRTAQLQAANQELEAFSYSVSHDLRTPLSSIAGFSGLLGKEIAANAPSERSQHYLARIRAGASQMGELIDALLALAQLSRTSLRWDSVDLSALAHKVLSVSHEREPDRQVALDIQPDMVVQGDALLLRQLLDNLLSNAWKFSGKQAQARISFRCDSGADGEAVYAVQDNGAGFDMAYSEKLFGAFQRLHTAADFAGTGIGLATVQRIVARHGGRVWAESFPGGGATFYFTLGTQAL